MIVENKRNYGVDLLRIVSMFMIVMLHVLGAGGVLSHTSFGMQNYFAAWGLENLALCAVNCYALISGYVGIYSTFRLKNIVALWLQVEFYSLGIALLLYFAFPGVFGVGEIVKSAFPVLFERYWYFTAYFLMFFMTPFMKRFVLETSKQSIMKFFAALFILLSVLPTVVDKDVFYTMNGYSALWLMIMYILGASIRHFGLWQNKKNGFYVGEYGTKWIKKC
jgi:surface polysaccharide O-acyltransferase-like enzyme